MESCWPERQCRRAKHMHIHVVGAAQGDVGCGKTVVAFLAALLAHADGYQTAMMCPTEVLAAQHCQNFERLFAQLPEVQPALV